MHKRLLLLALACLAGGIASTASLARPASSFTVRSTLDGMTVLPHRIHWLGTPNIAPAQIKEVDFLIDGKLRWVEHHTPYVYGADSGAHQNSLVTSWLPPGKHRFTVRAVTVDGRKATDTVQAQVVLPPQPPAALAGTWERTISDTSTTPQAGSSGNPTSTLTPPGRYTITFDRRWIHDVFPCDTTPCRYNPHTGGGGEFVSDWTPGSSTFTVRGPVTFRIFHDTDRLGGFWCREDGPAATYTWAVSGNTLTLTPEGGHDACRIRGAIWAGTWTRTG